MHEIIQRLRALADFRECKPNNTYVEAADALENMINRAKAAWLALPLPTATEERWITYIRDQLSKMIQPDDIPSQLVVEHYHRTTALQYIASGLSKLSPCDIARVALDSK